MKRSRVIAALATLVMGMTACAGPDAFNSSQSGQSAGGQANAAATIDIGSLYEPTNLSNSGSGGQGATEALTGNVYETLFRLTDSGDVEPWLATEDVVSEDGLTHTLTIREGVTFSSGKEMTVNDVVASIKHLLSDESQSARKKEVSVISDVQAPDSTTVVLTLSEPSVSLDYDLSGMWVVPEGLDTTTQTDGTGPYTGEGWTKGSTLTLKVREDYWGDKPANAGAIFHYFTDATSMTNALQAGDIDIVTNVQSPDAIPTFDSNANFTVSDGMSTTKELLAFNDRVKPFDDARVRKAVYSAIDRDKLLESVWADKGQVIGSMVPPSDPWYEDLTGLNPYDPELSRSLLAEAGLAGGFSFTLDTPTYDPHPLVAEFVKSELAKIGVTVTINPITADEWYSKVFTNKDYEATLQEHVNTRDVVWYANPDFYWGYDNPEVSDLVERSQHAHSTDEQADLLRQANRIIAEEATSAWLYLYPQVVIARSHLNGYGVNGLNSQFFVAGISESE